MPITVREVDGTPTYVGVAVLSLNQDDGFELEQPGTHEARVNFKSTNWMTKGAIRDVVQLNMGTGNAISTFNSQVDISNALSFCRARYMLNGHTAVEYDFASNGTFLVGVHDQTQLKIGLHRNDGGAYHNSFVFGSTTGTFTPFKVFIQTAYTASESDYTEAVSATVNGLTFLHGLYTSGSVSVSIAFADLTAHPTTLSGYGITDAQPLDADLTALAALAGTDTIYYRSGVSTWSAVTIGTGLNFAAGTLTATFTAVPDADYGDIVVSAGGTIWTIESCAISALTPIAGLSSAAIADADTIPFSDNTASDANKKTTALALRSYMVPPGTVFQYAGSSLPSGWLDCDGSAVSRTTYADLFAAIGTTWGAGNGSTTFNVPDLRGRALIGVGTGSGLTARSLSGSGGTETHNLSTAELATHNHGANVGGTAGAFSVLYNNIGSGGLAYGTAGGSGPWQFTGVETATSNAGSGSAHNNMQPFANLYHIIKT